ncbi:hypothetical protein Fleli_2365 [Bernardetia litoralis DSM 6794]|uniref:Uncharacterized protein n=1 Tax=Bernardetia litoralis (strain ATCC 23117 / DSM 6794 / NBRC 15988 / NCIMB 1366 / Fx l1 / Sio-4) TaxID=880071 RepID=I4ALA2_BERLS|nr:hypothetical protein [Bernardetia litoralis]AFM04737.1 hypothetical protein Fleli_2365 [Bernardetia litoralis DSM 6794]
MSPEVPVIVLILAVPSYFICKWLMTRLKVGNERNRKFLAIIPTIILSPIIYIGLFMIWIFSISYYPTSNFDKNEWNSNIEERFKMSEDIIESEILIDKTREEVIEILGNDFITNNESKITYELGHVPGLFNIDPDYLDIKLENGKVISVKQYEG